MSVNHRMRLSWTDRKTGVFISIAGEALEKPLHLLETLSETPGISPF